MAGETIYKDRATDLGNIRIHDDVLASIAAIAAGEIKGVHKLGGGFARSVYDLFAKRRTAKGVRVTSSENEVRIAVSIVVDYGVHIPRVADEIQENVKRQVEKMTGLVIHEVNVDVEGVHGSPAVKETAQ